jgi:anthranilate synthase
MHEASSFTTPGGVDVSCTVTEFDPALMAGLAQQVEQRRGGVLSSGMEYPGRYSRWEVAYVDPCVEVAARGRLITARALNERGAVIFGVIDAALRRVGVPADHPAVGPAGGDAGSADAGSADAGSADADRGLPGTTVFVPAADGSFTEEERSRQPTVFSRCGDHRGVPDPNLGLYGALGYDLAFQFEPVRLRIPRDGQLRDLVLHLPDRVHVVDRKRESALCYSYEFSVAGRSTAGLPRETAASPGGAARGEPTVTREIELPGDPVPGEYAALVGRARERFAQGDLFEVVPGHVFHARCSSPAAFYQRLRQRNPGSGRSTVHQ